MVLLPLVSERPTATNGAWRKHDSPLPCYMCRGVRSSREARLGSVRATSCTTQQLVSDAEESSARLGSGSRVGSPATSPAETGASSAHPAFVTAAASPSASCRHRKGKLCEIARGDIFALEGVSLLRALHVRFRLERLAYPQSCACSLHPNPSRKRILKGLVAA